MMIQAFGLIFQALGVISGATENVENILATIKKPLRSTPCYLYSFFAAPRSTAPCFPRPLTAHGPLSFHQFFFPQPADLVPRNLQALLLDLSLSSYVSRERPLSQSVPQQFAHPRFYFCLTHSSLLSLSTPITLQRGGAGRGRGV